MSNETKDVSVKVERDYFWPCLALLVIFCWGEPDLLDALIGYLRSHTG